MRWVSSMAADEFRIPQPTALRQRVPPILGSRHGVELLASYPG